MAKFGIIGGGAWGLAVAMKCVESAHNVSVWVHSEASAASISSQSKVQAFTEYRIAPTRG